MRDYLFSTDMVRLAFVVGVAVSMLLYERLHLTTGSIVVPGYIAIFLVYPLVIAATFATAFAAHVLVTKVIRRRVLLYGKAKFTVIVSISIVLQTVMLKVTPTGGWLWESDIPLFVGVGYVIPALLAHDMGRQGVRTTARAVMIAGVVTAIPIAAALVLDLPGVNDLRSVTGYGTMSIAAEWMPVAVLLSAVTSWAIDRNYGLRSGGFVGAAYVGLFMGDPFQVLAAGSVAVVAYLFVTRCLMDHLILFGRRKFAAILLSASMVSWTGLWAGALVLPDRFVAHLDVTSLALSPLFLPGLLANDMHRTSPGRVVLGAGLGATFVVTWTWLAEAISGPADIDRRWVVVAFVSAVVVFAPQFARSVSGALAGIGPTHRRSPSTGPAASMEAPLFAEVHIGELADRYRRSPLAVVADVERDAAIWLERELAALDDPIGRHPHRPAPVDEPRSHSPGEARDPAKRWWIDVDLRPPATLGARSALAR
jgi:poly-gamma-glutamate biosynthesis protein PgsC/CapC